MAKLAVLRSSALVFRFSLQCLDDVQKLGLWFVQSIGKLVSNLAVSLSLFGFLHETQNAGGNSDWAVATTVFNHAGAIFPQESAH